MSENSSALVSKVWNFANVLRDDGVGYGDYLEQITYLLFLKMADEMSTSPYTKKIILPVQKDSNGTEIAGGELCNWETLSSKRGAALGIILFPNAELSCFGKGDLGTDIYQKSK